MGWFAILDDTSLTKEVDYMVLLLFTGTVFPAFSMAIAMFIGLELSSTLMKVLFIMLRRSFWPSLLIKFLGSLSSTFFYILTYGVEILGNFL